MRLPANLPLRLAGAGVLLFATASIASQEQIRGYSERRQFRRDTAQHRSLWNPQVGGAKLIGRIEDKIPEMRADVSFFLGMWPFGGRVLHQMTPEVIQLLTIAVVLGSQTRRIFRTFSRSKAVERFWW
jgi:hypothetical protein